MITSEIKKRQDLITDLINTDSIYVTMYGMHKSKDKIIKIKTKDISKFVFDWEGKGPAFIYLWGWPGPDGNIYIINEYGETWALTEEELTTYSRGEE